MTKIKKILNGVKKVKHPYLCFLTQEQEAIYLNTDTDEEENMFSHYISH